MSYGNQEKITKDLYLFWRNDFGQWAKRSFCDIDGTVYNCAEQYMMAKKAILFGDIETHRLIMAANEAKEHQQLGRKIQGFDHRLWDVHKIGIVWSANFLKFNQHDDLKQRLIDTGNRIIAEATPTDCIWGIGFSPDQAEALDVKQWRGTNLLGVILMSLRSVMKQY